jgi:hypothetical protein
MLSAPFHAAALLGRTQSTFEIEGEQRPALCVESVALVSEVASASGNLRAS